MINGEQVVRKTRMLANPTAPDLGERFRRRLARMRSHRRRWPEPECEIIFNLHSRVYTAPHRGLHYAELQLEIPEEHGFDYFIIVRGASTRKDALILVIRALEAQEWFHSFRAHGARFRVTGSELENLYKGYL